jgi:hypothetical protein
MTETLIQRLCKLGREDGWTTNSLIKEAANALEASEREIAVYSGACEKKNEAIDYLRTRISELEGALEGLLKATDFIGSGVANWRLMIEEASEHARATLRNRRTENE